MPYFGAKMANVTSLALHSSIYGTEVAKVASLVAHCSLHGTEEMTICFNISGVQKNHRFRTVTLLSWKGPTVQISLTLLFYRRIY